MHPPHAELFHGWHDFFILLGTASATLVGLMFIAVSIGASYLQGGEPGGARGLLGPTIVHFTSVLVFCILALPSPRTTGFRSRAWPRLIGFAGFLFSARIWFRLTRSRSRARLHRPGFSTRCCRRSGYLIVLFAAALLYQQSEWGLDALPPWLIDVLLLAAIRNAWDMMTWIALKVPSAGEKAKTRARQT